MSESQNKTADVRILTRVEKPKEDMVKCILCRMSLPRHQAYRVVVSEWRPPNAAEVPITFTIGGETEDGKPRWQMSAYMPYDTTAASTIASTSPVAFVTEHSAYACSEEHGEVAISIKVAELRHNGDKRGETRGETEG